MKKQNRNGRRGGNAFAALAFMGFLLTLTEFHGGPWAGSFIGAAMLICGALALLRTKIERRSER